MANCTPCADCLPCAPQFTKKKVPCGMATAPSTTYPYFPTYFQPPAGTITLRGTIPSTTESDAFTAGGSATFDSVAVSPPVDGTLNAVGLLWSPLTGSGPYQVSVADDGAGGVDVTIPASVLYSLINQGVFTVAADVTIVPPYFLTLQVFQS